MKGSFLHIALGGADRLHNGMREDKHLFNS